MSSTMSRATLSDAFNGRRAALVDRIGRKPRATVVRRFTEGASQGVSTRRERYRRPPPRVDNSSS